MPCILAGSKRFHATPHPFERVLDHRAEDPPGSTATWFASETDSLPERPHLVNAPPRCWMGRNPILQEADDVGMDLPPEYLR